MGFIFSGEIHTLCAVGKPLVHMQFTNAAEANAVHLFINRDDLREDNPFANPTIALGIAAGIPSAEIAKLLLSL